MRYIIIPLAIIGYLYWSYYAIKDIKLTEYWKDSTSLWAAITFLVGLSLIVYVSIMYW